jgi:hypothetical protein
VDLLTANSQKADGELVNGVSGLELQIKGLQTTVEKFVRHNGEIAERLPKQLKISELAGLIEKLCTKLDELKLEGGNATKPAESAHWWGRNK